MRNLNVISGLVCLVLATVWGNSVAYGFCEVNGKKIAHNRVFEQADKSLLVCKGSILLLENTDAPIMVRRADLKNLDEPSQYPQCNAREGIVETCGVEKLCKVVIETNLCEGEEVTAQASDMKLDSTTHIDLEWRCRTARKWTYQRIARGDGVILDCRK